MVLRWEASAESCPERTHLPRCDVVVLREQTFESLHGQRAGLLCGHLQIARDSHALAIDVPEPQADLGLDFLLIRHLRDCQQQLEL